VIHEHDALPLASAAMDFPLTAAETQRLNDAVADCPVCAERAMAYRRQGRLIAELPTLEVPYATRRRVMHAARIGSRPDTRTPMLLLAAALLIGALLAVAAAVGGAFNPDRRLTELPPVESVSPSAPAVAVPSPSLEPAQSEDPGSGTGTNLPPDSIADVVSSNLRVRSQPRVATDSFKFEPLLQPGDRVFVIDGPVVANDYDWYEVAAWRPSTPSVSLPMGWVARADHDGTPWIQGTTPDCPAAPTIALVIAMDPHEALACFGRRPLVLRAVIADGVPGDGCHVDGAVRRCIVGPGWLAGSSGRTASGTAGSGPDALQLSIDPNRPVPVANLLVGRTSVLEGAFDHPDAIGCRFDGYPSGPSLTADDAILRCRTRFVVSQATPDGNFLVPQTAAVTTSDRLRVRSRPVVDATSQPFEPLLPTGTRLFVVQGPVAGSGYDWYEVIALAIRRLDGGPMVGWIAVAGKTGETWAKVLPLDCPSPDGLVGLADVERLATWSASDGGLSCFGDRTITTAAMVHVVCKPSSSTPAAAWLSSPSPASLVMTDGASTFEARLHPDAVESTCKIPQDVRWNVEGHFDDPDSASCATGSAADAVVARYQCRSIFVVTLLARTG
jgi:hypothetical protein